MDCCDAFFVGAVSAAEEGARGFDPVTDDLAAAMFAFGGQRMYGALKTIEIMRDAVDDDLETLVVIIPANFTTSHN